MSQSLETLPSTYLPTLEKLGGKLTAQIITPDTSWELCERAVALVSRAYDPKAHERYGQFLDRLRRGQVVIKESDRSDIDFGLDIEASAFYLYLENQKVVAVAGLYRRLHEPGRFWGGLMAVAEEKQKSFIAARVLTHIVATLRYIRESVGENLVEAAIYFFTEETESNQSVQEFYESLGAQRLPGKSRYLGNEQRIYCIDLETKPGNRLTRLVDRLKLHAARFQD